MSDALDSIKDSIINMGKEKIGKVLIDGVSAGVTANIKYASKLATRAVKEIDALYKIGIISEQEYYKELEAIRDEYLAEGCEDWWKYTAKIGEYETKVLAENADAVAAAYEEMIGSATKDIEGLTSDAAATFEQLAKEKESFSEKLSDYGGLYSKGTVTIKNAGPGMQLIDGSWIDQKDIVFDYVKFDDFEKQVEVLEDYRDTLMAIKERGNVPGEIFGAIRTLSVDDGLKVANAMLEMSDEEFNKYIDGYINKKNIEQEIANEVFNEDIEKAKAYYQTTTNELLEELKKSFESVPESFFDGGIDSANAFGEGFIQSIDGIIDAIKIEIESKLGEISSNISAGYGGAGSNIYNSSYNFYGSGQSVSEQLEEARIADTVSRLRG